MKYDLLVIGLGPAGMAVSIMASEMGLSVCAIEKHKIGGECMNVGCIPSKALLQIANTRHIFHKLEKFHLEKMELPKVNLPFPSINQDLKYINENKTKKMFDKVDLILNQGDACFVDPHTVEVNGKQISAKKIFIATGTKPAIPPVEGIEQIDLLTNENMFNLDNIPSSLIVLGGGAIGCEMAQAFARLGSKVTVVHMGTHLLPFGPAKPGQILKEVFTQEGILVLNNRSIRNVKRQGEQIVLTTVQGETLAAEKLLVATGRTPALMNLKLENAKIKYDHKGIKVNRFLQTNQKHIFAVGDCNGHYLFSHAAMHQGMIALMNAMIPTPFKINFKKFVVPWTVFTQPQISSVGKNEQQLKKYERIISQYQDYGAAIAEKKELGYVEVLATSRGKILGATVVGEGSGEMINEWGLAIQKKINLFSIMMLQHSFPTMSFLNKRIAETWMMNRIKPQWTKNLIRRWFRL